MQLTRSQSRILDAKRQWSSAGLLPSGSPVYIIRLSDGKALAVGYFRRGIERMRATFVMLGIPCVIRHPDHKKPHAYSALMAGVPYEQATGHRLTLQASEKQ